MTYKKNIFKGVVKDLGKVKEWQFVDHGIKEFIGDRFILNVTISQIAVYKKYQGEKHYLFTARSGDFPFLFYLASRKIKKIEDYCLYGNVGRQL